MARKRSPKSESTPAIPDRDFISAINSLLGEARSLLATRRSVDRLLDSRYRLEARLFWLLREGGVLPAPGSAATATPVVPSLEALRADLQERSTDSRQEQALLERQVESLRTLLKQVEDAIPPPPSPAAPQLTPLQSALVKFVLLRNGVISATDEMVLAPDRETGVGGVSDIRFIDIVHPTGVVVRHLIAKFDRADRADREWETMEHLRLLSLSRDIVLPEKYSHGDDGVIVSPAARTTNSGPARQFASYVRENLLPAPQNCVASIELAFGLLGQFYRIHPGDHTDRVGSSRSTWGAAMPRGWAAPGANVLYLGDVEVLYDACRHHWSKPAVDAWKTARSFSKDNGWEVPRPIPNPIGRLPRLLDRQTGPVRLSRIHGDLNLTNLMVAAHPDGTPEKVFVIDLANSERDRPTAFDFARLEVAFWVEMFGTLVRPDQQEADWMPHLIALRDRLDGRPPVSAPGPLGGLREFGKLVNAVRHQAFLALRPPGTPDIGGHYILTDYFHGLYFTFLSMFRHDSIRANGFQCRMLLLGASLSLRVLDDTVGYGSNAESPFPRPWESAEFE